MLLNHSKTRKISVLVDYGGSWVRILVSRNGKTIVFRKEKSPPLNQLDRALKKNFLKWKIGRPDYLIVGARSVWTEPERKSLHQKCSSLAQKALFFSDIELGMACLLRASPGIMLVAGTGSIALGRDADGHLQRAGGLGRAAGDEGSGLWIAQQWLQDNGQNPAKAKANMLEMVEKIMKLAELEEPQAKNLLERAQNKLSQLVLQVHRKLHFKKHRFVLGCTGGLFHNSFFRKGFLLELKRFVKPEEVRFSGEAKETLLVGLGYLEKTNLDTFEWMRQYQGNLPGRN